MSSSDLLQLGSGPLSNILLFLDVKDLVCAESTCRMLRSLSPCAWDLLDNTTITNNSRVGQSDADTPKERVQRRYKAQRFAERMEALAEQHFNYDEESNLDENGTETRDVFCDGCQQFPDLDQQVYRGHEHYEFFVRFSYRNSNTERGSDDGSSSSSSDADLLIWEGFVPARPLCHWFAALYAAYLSVHAPVGHNARISTMDDRTWIRFYGTKPTSLQISLMTIIKNLKVTVVALRRNRTCKKMSLVVATGGFGYTSTRLKRRQVIPSTVAR